MKHQSALFDTEKQFHIAAGRGDAGEYVILPGDPGRVEKIAALLDDPHPVACNREFNLWAGTLLGRRVGVCSTGIGGPSAAIALEELCNIGAHTFIRVGTSGGIDMAVSGGDLVIATAAVRAEGASYEYLPEGYPAAADFTVVSALRDVAEGLSEDADGKRYHIGVVQSKDSFYGETEPERMPVSDMLEQKWRGYVRCGCLASEMEAAALFSVGITRRVRVGAVLTAIWNVERTNAGLSDTPCNDSSRAISCAVEAMRILIAQDA